MKDLKVKVCGMRNLENISEVIKAGADMLGFIFFEKSKRYVEESLPFRGVGGKVLKAGVFVNAKEQYINAKIADYQLDYVQLHGDESPEYCTVIKAENPKVKVIKVFSVGASFDFTKTEEYQAVADLFLFDTKGKERGGNGFKFNWKILQEYQGETPFLLSGGISLEDVEAVKAFKHPKLWGVDINSGFESAPAIKKAKEVEQFIVETMHRSV